MAIENKQQDDAQQAGTQLGTGTPRNTTKEDVVIADTANDSPMVTSPSSDMTNESPTAATKIDSPAVSTNIMIETPLDVDSPSVNESKDHVIVDDETKDEEASAFADAMGMKMVKKKKVSEQSEGKCGVSPKKDDELCESPRKKTKASTGK